METMKTVKTVKRSAPPIRDALVMAFDVGFRNLAFCCAEVRADDPAVAKVIGWGTIDLGADWRKMLYMAQFTRLADALDVLLDDLDPDGDGGVSSEWHAVRPGRDTRVYVEQQPSRNPTMKNIEAMLKCYFSMRAHYRAERVRVVSVSARAKLRHVAAGDAKKTYAARKRTAIEEVRAMIAAGGDAAAPLAEEFAAHKKRDDLADAALYVCSATGASRLVKK